MLRLNVTSRKLIICLLTSMVMRNPCRASMVMRNAASLIITEFFFFFHNYFLNPNGPMRPKAEWAIHSEAMRARRIIVLVKSN